VDETQRMLTLLNDTFPDITQLDPLEARALVNGRVRDPSNLDDVRSAVDASVAAADRTIPVRVYEPHEPREGAASTVFLHGGGFIHGSVASHDGFCRRWSKGTGSTVVSVEYRLAPEHRAPAGRDDAIAAVRWAEQQGFARDGLLIAGDSSGGNLAASAAIALRDQGSSPLTGQVLLYPFLDPTMSSNSYRTRGTGYFVTAQQLAYYWRSALGDERFGHHAADPSVTPLAASDLSGLPPAIVVTGGLDPLSDEGIDYAARLRAAGVPVLERRYPDQFHGFVTIPGYDPGLSASEVLWTDIKCFLTSTKDHS
jgi:acetyl esterase